MNYTMGIPPYKPYNFSTRKVYYWSRRQRFMLVNPLPFVLNIVIKYPFFFSSSVLIFLRNGSFLCLEKRFVTTDMQCSLFFSWRVWGSQMLNMLTFFKNLFQVKVDCGLGCVEVNCKFSSTFALIAFHQFF